MNFLPVAMTSQVEEHIMASPFPGMDPFIESQLWEDFHGDVIPIPLETYDPGVVVDLQQAFNQTYERGGYDYMLDYHREVSPELNATERRWVSECQESAGFPSSERPA